MQKLEKKKKCFDIRGGFRVAGLYLESITNAFIRKRIFTYLPLYVNDEGRNEGKTE